VPDILDARSDAFPACLALLLERGAVLEDPRIAPVLLDDADGLAAAGQRAEPLPGVVAVDPRA